MPFASIPEAIEDFRAGRMLVVVDDEDRENEGDLTIAAEKVTPEIINFMAHARPRPDLPLAQPRDLRRAAPAADVAAQHLEFRHGVLRIHRRARRRDHRHFGGRPRPHHPVAIDPASKPHDLARPGHVFPLRAREGGVLVRAGQTEAAVDLARLAGLRPGGVICEIMNETAPWRACRS